MKPFPTDDEIIDAIQLLARTNVLREYEIITTHAAEMVARYPSYLDRASDEAKRQMALKLVDVMVGSDGWVPSRRRIFDDREERIHGWVIAYADARRALTKKASNP